MRLWISVSLTLVLGACGMAAPAPFWPARRADTSAEGLLLTLRTGEEARRPDMDAKDVEVAIHNLTRRERVLDDVRVHSGILSCSLGVRFVLRFPDGAVYVTPRRPFATAEVDPRVPLRLGPGRSLSCAFSNLVPFHTRDLSALMRKNRYRYCLTAVLPARCLQSNTLPVEGCPPPPADYRPLDHVK